MSVQSVGEIVQNLFTLTSELERLYPKRSFTPDARAVESLGEVLAAKWFDLELLPASSKIHNARTRDLSRMVQIKTTQGDSLVFRNDQIPQHLLVIKLSVLGMPELIYNGPGPLAYAKSGRQLSNGQRAVRICTLRKIQVSVQEQLPPCSSDYMA